MPVASNPREAGSGNGTRDAPLTARSPMAPLLNGNPVTVVSVTSQPLAMPRPKSSRSQSPSLTRELVDGAVNVQDATPFIKLVVSVQPIEVSCDRQVRPPFVCDSRTAKVTDVVRTVVVQSKVKIPPAEGIWMLPQDGLPGPPPFTLTRPSTPSA